MISVDRISKQFKYYHTPVHRLKEIIFRKKLHKELVALIDISFDVQDGETLGVIGMNGSGKSTLLKIITGVLMPDSGNVHVDGRVTGLLELGTGFNFEFSGRDNIFLNGTYLGFSHHEIEKKLDDIIDFAELNDFICEPLKAYSSGMIMRLAFSVAIHSDLEAFVVDEALSVGDAYFQQKCMGKIKEFKRQDGSIIFVSHDMNAVKILCDKTILLHEGRIVERGKPEKVINTYNYLIAKKTKSRDIVRRNSGCGERYGNRKVTVDNVQLCNEERNQVEIFQCGRPIDILIDITCHVPVNEITVGILFRDKFGQDIYGTNSFDQQVAIRLLEGEQRRVCFSFGHLNLGYGNYSLTVAAHTGENHINECFEWVDNCCTFEVVAGTENPFIGLCRHQPHVSIINNCP